MMKHVTFILALLAFSVVLSAAQSSPYLETGTLNVNNSGFKSTSLRSTSIGRPVPMHTDTEPVNATVSPRFVVAKADVSFLALIYTGSWALANGLDLSVNLALINLNLALPTGCNSYIEVGSGLGGIAGNWRVPTQRELILIYLVHKELDATSGLNFTNFDTDTAYWSSTQSTATTAWVLNMGSGISSTVSKSSGYRVRCIRDL